MKDTKPDTPTEISPRIIYRDCLSSKKKALESIATAMAADADLSIGDILDAFMKRERLGSTNFGHGIAIPHGRLASCKKPIGVLLIVNQCMCDNPDKEPVDLIFGLIVPENACKEDKELLQSIASLTEASEALKVLRTEKDPLKLYKWIKSTNPRLAEILV